MRLRWMVPAAVTVAVVSLPVTVAAAHTAVPTRTARHGTAATTCLSLAPAAYGQAVWNGIVAPHTAPAVAIANWGGTTNNPSSGGGPGGSYSKASQKDITAAEQNGVTLLGYVWTDVADTDKSGPPASLSEVEAQVRAWKSWYGITDIFFDGAASSGGAKDVAYYKALYTYVHQLSAGSVVWLNPGDYPASVYMSVSDVILDWETGGSLPKSPPKWVLSYPASRFANFVHSYGGSVATALAAFRADHAQYAFVTESYASLPSYWATEQADACS